MPAASDSSLHAVIHSLDQALAAAAVAQSHGVGLALWTDIGGANSVGAGWLVAVGRIVGTRHPQLRLTLVLDCADEAGAALAALRAGLRDICFSGGVDVAKKLVALGARLWRRSETTPVDLAGERHPADACRIWLARRNPVR